jgi:hypothetical protein
VSDTAERLRERADKLEAIVLKDPKLWTTADFLIVLFMLRYLIQELRDGALEAESRKLDD